MLKAANGAPSLPKPTSKLTDPTPTEGIHAYSPFVHQPSRRRHYDHRDGVNFGIGQSAQQGGWHLGCFVSGARPVHPGARGRAQHRQSLYNTIIKDKRHKDVELVAIEEIETRKFPKWSMAHVIISEDDPIVQLKHPEFDPFEASSEQLKSLIDDLLEQSTPIN
jgi:hypothetical protein